SSFEPSLSDRPLGRGGRVLFRPDCGACVRTRQVAGADTSPRLPDPRIRLDQRGAGTNTTTDGPVPPGAEPSGHSRIAARNITGAHSPSGCEVLVERLHPVAQPSSPPGLSALTADASNGCP